jgi:hypothetical protein
MEAIMYKQQNKVNLNVKIDRSLYMKVKAINKIDGLKMHEIIEEAIKLYVNDYKKNKKG